LSRTSFIFALFGLAVACGQPFGEDPDTTEGALDAVPGRWTLPASVAAVGAETHITYDDAGPWSRKNCAKEQKAGTRAVGEFLLEKFPAIQEAQGFNCRPNTANTSRLSVHGTGRALDLIIPRVGGKANNVKGDPIANYCVEHATEIGIQMIIWDQTVWRANGKNDSKYGGPNPHTDHLHVELTEEAAAMKTAFFVNGPRPERDGGVSEAGTPPPEEPDEPPVEPDEPPPPPPPPPPQTTPDAGMAPTPPPAVQPTSPKTTPSGPDEDDEPAEPIRPRAKETRATAAELDRSSSSDGCSATGRSGSWVAFPAMLLMLVVSRARRRRG
jgi:uncharacterized protein (TIGR03382 family)